MQERAERARVSLRPHVKTHKTIEAALLQCSHQPEGQRSIVVSTMAEAWFYALSGEFHEILYTCPLTPDRFEEVSEIMEICPGFAIMTEHFLKVSAMEAYCAKKKKSFNVWLKVDTGYHRAGVNISPDKTQKEWLFARDLCERLAFSPHLDFKGIYSHCGHSYSRPSEGEGPDPSEAITAASDEDREAMNNFRRYMAGQNVTIPCVAVGSTPSCAAGDPLYLLWDGIDEWHPGNYVFFDRTQQHFGACTEDDIAVSVLTRVVSQYVNRNEILVDAGALALTQNQCGLPGWGAVRGDDNIVIKRMSQEMCLLHSLDGSRLPFQDMRVDSLVEILPNHSCHVAAMFPEMFIRDASTAPVVETVDEEHEASDEDDDDDVHPVWKEHDERVARDASFGADYVAYTATRPGTGKKYTGEGMLTDQWVPVRGW